MSWDDGKHTKVKRVQLTFDDAIRSIEVEYDGTSLKSQPRGTVGTKSDGFTLSSDEYITEVNGYSKTTFSGEVITSLTFKTNKQTYGTYGNKTRSSSHALNSINAHFAPAPPPGTTGGNSGGTTGTESNTSNTGSNPGEIGSNTGGNGSNTGSGTTGNTTGGNNSNPGGNGSNTGGNGSNTGSGTTGGPGTTGNTTGGDNSNPGGNGSNTGGNGSNTGSETTGNTTGGNNSNPEGIESNTGGNGSNTDGSGTTGNTSGGNNSNTGNTGTNTSDSGSSTNSSPQKLEAQGGKRGNEWDDGGDHDGVTNIHVAPGGRGIEQIRFDYINNGQSKEGPFHGVKGRGVSSTFVINHPDEYLVSVEGWYDNYSNIIQGIEFKTNTNTSQYFGYEFSGDGPQFSLEVKEKKIIGFHGFADSHLTSLGAYFVPISLTPPAANKVDAQGGNYGEAFDDGAFDHVRKVYVGQGHSGVNYVKFDYEKDGKKETREHGEMTRLGTEEFEVDQGDYITSIDVYVDKVYGYKSEIVVALTFKTFKGKTSQRFGMETENKYELKDGKGGKLAGFHGKASDVLYALGAYFTPTAN